MSFLQQNYQNNKLLIGINGENVGQTQKASNSASQDTFTDASLLK